MPCWRWGGGAFNSRRQLLDATPSLQQSSHRRVLTCQCGSKTGREASQPAVAVCFPVRGPQPSCGCMLKAQSAEGTVEGRSPDAPASSATMWPAPTPLPADRTDKNAKPQGWQDSHAQAMSAKFGAAGVREWLHTLVPCGTGLKALFHIPAKSVLRTPVSIVRDLSFPGHQPGRM